MTGVGKSPAGATDQRASWWRSETGVRTLSAVVLLPVVLFLVWLGGWGFAALVAALAALVLVEWLDICAIPRGGLVTGLIGAVATATALGGLYLAPLSAFGLAVVLSGLMAAVAPPRRGYALAGALYALLPTVALVLLRRGDQGVFLIAFVFAVVWATDVLAYVVGRALKGPKLCPAISPGKTWSGAIGGFVSGVGAGVGIGLLAGSPDPLRVAVLSAVLSVGSILGDLFESGLKRRFKVKDASRLIPGHGGVMDRVDGVIAAALLAVLLGYLLGGSAGAGAGLFGR